VGVGGGGSKVNFSFVTFYIILPVGEEGSVLDSLLDPRMARIYISKKYSKQGPDLNH
jgi:hypothetical protein